MWLLSVVSELADRQWSVRDTPESWTRAVSDVGLRHIFRPKKMLRTPNAPEDFSAWMVGVFFCLVSSLPAEPAICARFHALTYTYVIHGDTYPQAVRKVMVQDPREIKLHARLTGGCRERIHS